MVNSLYNYPTHMVFFTTPELLEIGGLPMTSLNEKPGRTEALKYYRRVAEYYQLNIHQYERVLSIDGDDGDFHVTTSKAEYRARKIVLATGYYDRSQHAERPGRRAGQGHPLLQGAASLLQSRRAGGRREELGGHRGAGTVSGPARASR